MEWLTILKLVGPIIGVIVGFFGWWRVRRIIRDRVRIKELENANKGWVEADELIGKAHDARRRATGPNADLLRDDGYKRPKS